MDEVSYVLPYGEPKWVGGVGEATFFFLLDEFYEKQSMEMKYENFNIQISQQQGKASCLVR